MMQSSSSCADPFLLPSSSAFHHDLHPPSHYSHVIASSSSSSSHGSFHSPAYVAASPSSPTSFPSSISPINADLHHAQPNLAAAVAPPSPPSFSSDVASAPSFRCSSISASTTSLHSSKLVSSSASVTTNSNATPPSKDAFATSMTELDAPPSNDASSTSFPYVPELHQPFQKGLRASLCTDVDESIRPSSSAGFHDPFGSWEKDGPTFSPLTSSGYNFSDSGTVGLPWRPSFKTTREMLKRRPATAIKMTYMSVKEKVDREVDANNLAMVTLQSAQRINRRSSVSSSSSSRCKPIVRSHDRKWVYEANTVTHEEQLTDIIRNLENCKKKWENDGNYLQAATVAKQLQALKIFLENKRRTTMLKAHCKEKEDAESAYKAELNEKNKLWKGRFKVFQDEVIQHAQFLKQQHAIALQSFRNKMYTRIPKKPQLSRDLLNERKVQTVLGKQGKYLEAQTVKSHADHKEFKELQATLDAFQCEVSLKERALKAKQQSEMSILLQRAAQTRDEFKKNKENEIACCIQRHKHILEDLEALHKQERLKFEQRMKKIIREFRAVGGEMRDLSHAMEKLVVPAVTTECGGIVADFASSSSKLDLETLNIGGLSR